MSETAVVRANGVARTFGTGEKAVVAVHAATCEVTVGDQVALTGPSGSGKTTLLHLLAGLDLPTTGVVEWPAIGTINMLRPGPIAMVFQGPSLLPPLDVLENVALPLLLQGTPRASARVQARAALSRLSLESLATKLPEELSGGQAQRIAVVRALTGSPQLILADEPTGQLDHDSAVQVIDALVTGAAAIGAALIVNTHDSSLVARFPIHWSMSGGRLTQQDLSSC